MICPKCQHENDEKAIQCAQCGEPLRSNDSNSPTAEPSLNAVVDNVKDQIQAIGGTLLSKAQDTLQKVKGTPGQPKQSIWKRFCALSLKKRLLIILPIVILVVGFIAGRIVVPRIQLALYNANPYSDPMHITHYYYEQLLDNNEEKMLKALPPAAREDYAGKTSETIEAWSSYLNGASFEPFIIDAGSALSYAELTMLVEDVKDYRGQKTLQMAKQVGDQYIEQYGEEIKTVYYVYSLMKLDGKMCYATAFVLEIDGKSYISPVTLSMVGTKDTENPYL